jgi:hypothetical protein
MSEPRSFAPRTPTSPEAALRAAQRRARLHLLEARRLGIGFAEAREVYAAVKANLELHHGSGEA